MGGARAHGKENRRGVLPHRAHQAGRPLGHAGHGPGVRHRPRSPLPKAMKTTPLGIGCKCYSPATQVEMAEASALMVACPNIRKRLCRCCMEHPPKAIGPGYDPE